MGIKVVTEGTTSYIKRSTGVINYNSAYTVLFNLYLAGSGAANQYSWVWGLSGSTQANGGTHLGSRSDILKFNSSSYLRLICYDGTDTGESGMSATLSSGWHNISIRRSSLTSIILRVDGTDYSAVTADMTGREAVAWEFALGEGDTGAACNANDIITNYKSWTAALSTSEIDAEHDTASYIVTSNSYSQSAMGDESTLSNNLTQTGSSSTWSAGANVDAGTNDPGVNYNSGVDVALSGSAGTFALGAMPRTTAVPL